MDAVIFHRLTYNLKGKEGRKKARAYKAMENGNFDGIARRVPVKTCLMLKSHLELSVRKYDKGRTALSPYVDLAPYK